MSDIANELGSDQLLLPLASHHRGNRERLSAAIDRPGVTLRNWNRQIPWQAFQATRLRWRPSLQDSLRNPKLSRRDADDPLEVRAEMALIREAGAERDIRQAELAVCPQEVLRSFNAARDHILVRRQPGGRLELSRKVIGTEIGDGCHLLQRW